MPVGGFQPAAAPALAISPQAMLESFFKALVPPILQLSEFQCSVKLR